MHAAQAPNVAVTASVVGLLLTAMPFASQANERSERLVSRGLVSFHAGDHRGAHELFDQAVTEDPRDATALYYRGVTRGRLGQLDGALADLEEVSSLRPSMARAKLELGYLLFRMERYERALGYLGQAESDPALAAQAALLRGIVQVRTQQYERARQSLAAAADRDSRLAPTARFYQGVAELRGGDRARAAEHFAWTIEHAPHTGTAREARSYLDRHDAGRQRRYELHGRAGFDYDSNVALAPSNGELLFGLPEKDDGRAVLAAGGSYDLVRTRSARVNAGYELFQTLHFSEDDFDIQNHRVATELATRIAWVVVGVSLRYDYYLRKTDSFLHEPSVAPWVRLELGRLGTTELYYRFADRDFEEQPASELRDAVNHAAGLRYLQELGSPDRYVATGYRYDHEDADHSIGDLFSYDGHEVSAELGWPLPGALALTLAYAYRSEEYDGSASFDREDDVHRIVTELARELGQYLRLTARYFGTINDSTQSPFEYQRHVGSLALEMRY